MSPTADVRKEGEGGFVDRKGNFTVQFQGIAEETMKPKSPESSFRESLRVIYSLVDDDGKPTESAVSLAVCVEEPKSDLWGFVPEPEKAPDDDASALSSFIGSTAHREPMDVYVRGFIQSRLAPIGTHTFTRIVRVYQYRNKKNDARLGMVAVTQEGTTAGWNCPEPNLKQRGGNTPDDDYIDISPDSYAFQYLMRFGLDWERMKKEDLVQAPAFWDGYQDSEGNPIPALLGDITNPWPGFLRIAERHGFKPVKMKIVDDPTYGPGPERGAKSLVTMVEVDPSGATSAEFEREKLVFLELWDNLTKHLLKRDDARFLAGTKFTDDGRQVAVSVLRPLVLAYPDAVLVTKPDGTPAINVPPSPETWRLNGLVCANFTAERLFALSEEELFTIINLSDKTGEKVVAWAAENVPEWQAVGDEEGSEVL